MPIKSYEEYCMKTIIIVLLVACACPVVVVAQDSTANAKLDTVIQYQKQMSEQQSKIYNEVVRYKEPLEGKKYGIELNPAYLLASSARSYLVVSGGFSLFDVDRQAEIAFPLFYQSGTSSKDGDPLTLWNQDIVYRRFLGQHQDGFYICGGIRYTYIRGSEENGFSLFGTTIYSLGPSAEITTSKIGAMFGIGYRYFSSSTFYWGTGLVYGAYFSDDERDIKGVYPDDTKTILDFEILKFGVAF